MGALLFDLLCVPLSDYQFREGRIEQEYGRLGCQRVDLLVLRPREQGSAARATWQWLE